MEFTILLFARAKELVGRDRVAVYVAPPATVGDLLARLRAAHPQLAPLLDASAVAVNHEFADESRPLRPTDEIAVIPPVSGG